MICHLPFLQSWVLWLWVWYVLVFFFSVSAGAMVCVGPGGEPAIDLDLAAAENQEFFNTRTSERQEMIVLNDRLAVYIDKVKCIQTSYTECLPSVQIKIFARWLKCLFLTKVCIVLSTLWPYEQEKYYSVWFLSTWNITTEIFLLLQVRSLEQQNKLLETEIEAYQNRFEKPSGLRLLYEEQLKELKRIADQMRVQRVRQNYPNSTLLLLPFFTFQMFNRAERWNSFFSGEVFISLICGRLFQLMIQDVNLVFSRSLTW